MAFGDQLKAQVQSKLRWRPVGKQVELKWRWELPKFSTGGVHEASRRLGGQAPDPSRPGLKHILAHDWAPLGAAPGACPVAFGHPKAVRATKGSSAEALGPAWAARQASKRPCRTGTKAFLWQKGSVSRSPRRGPEPQPRTLE